MKTEPKDYAAMTNGRLTRAVAEAMGWTNTDNECGYPPDYNWLEPTPPSYLPLFIHDPADLRNVIRWAWEEHQLCISVFNAPTYMETVVEKDEYELASRTEDHDGTRASIDRAEGRAVCIALLRALDKIKKGGE